MDQLSKALNSDCTSTHNPTGASSLWCACHLKLSAETTAASTCHKYAAPRCRDLSAAELRTERSASDLQPEECGVIFRPRGHGDRLL